MILIDINQSLVIDDNSIVTLTKTNNIYEIQYMQKKNNSSNIKKLDSERYVILSSGEIKHFDKTTSRNQSENSLKQTFKKLRYLINANFSGKSNELWATLTFKDTGIAKNPESIYLEFNKFFKRLKYKYGNDLEYITIIEPHNISGMDLKSWHGFHLHLLLKNKRKKLYIPYYDFEKIWGLGHCRIERLNSIDNIGAYLSAYLTNIEVTDNSSNKEKKYLKGSRLWLYPKGIRIYRKSRGIIYPTRIQITYKEARKLIGVHPHYRKVYEVNKNDFNNIIIFEQFNTSRK